MRSSRFFLGLLFAVAGPCFSQEVSATDPAGVPLTLEKGDVRVQAFDDGYHIFIRAKPGLSSILIAEAFELPNHKLATYNFRALEPNDVNGQEKRILNGKFLKQPNTFLVSSTLRDDPYFGKAFVILLPAVVEYGYKEPGARYGKIDVRDELAKPGSTVWLSLRAFAKPYADYTGPYKDNAFELKGIVVAQTLPVDKGKYVKGFEALFHRLGPTYKSSDPEDAIRYVQTLFHDDQDVVLCIDTTKSMLKDMEAFRSDLLKPLRPLPYKNFRLGAVFYKDYMDPYLMDVLPFQTDVEKVQDALERHPTGGGGDVPEAAVEAIDKAAAAFPWQASSRLIVVLADAPQHDSPRGKITEEAMSQALAANKVDLRLVMLPILDY